MSAPSLSSYRSVTPAVPRLVYVDGALVSGDVASIAVPEHPSHHCVLVMPKHTAHVAAGFLEPGISGMAFTHAVVVNRVKPGAKGSPAYAPSITCDADPGDLQVLDPLCGAAWTAVEWLLAKAGHNAWGKSKGGIDAIVAEIVKGAPKFEVSMVSAVQTDTADVDVTRHTGSGNMGFHGKVSVHAATRRRETGSVPFPALLHLDAYARKQWRRPRNWVKPTLSPAGADPAEPAFKLDEWAENSYGLNAYDTQHPDASELHRMYVLTGHPIYLLQMLTLFSDMRRLSYYLQRAPAGKHSSWAGVARTPGWWAVNLGELIDALARSGGPTHVTWLDQVLGEADYLLGELEWHTQPAQWPLAGTTGSAPPELEDPVTGANVPYQMGWQLSPLAWGLQWIEGACRAWVGKIGDEKMGARMIAIATRARKLWRFVLDYVEGTLFRETEEGPQVCYAFSKEFAEGGTAPKVQVWQPVAAGTGMWHLAPLAAAGRITNPMGSALLAKARQIDKGMTGDLLELCPREVGKETLVPEVEPG